MAGLPGLPMKLRRWQPAHGRRHPRPRLMTPSVVQSTQTIAIVAAASGLATVAFALIPDLRLAPHWLTVRVALETSGSLIALVATFLIYGRLLRSTYLNELLLASAFGILAVANLLFVAVPKVAGWAPDDLTVWVTPFARGLGASET